MIHLMQQLGIWMLELFISLLESRYNNVPKRV